MIEMSNTEVRLVEIKEEKRCQVCARKLDEKACGQFCADNLENCLKYVGDLCYSCDKKKKNSTHLYVRGRENCCACSDKCAARLFDYLASRKQIDNHTRSEWYCALCCRDTASWNDKLQPFFYCGLPFLNGYCLSCEKTPPRRSARLAAKPYLFYD